MEIIETIKRLQKEADIYIDVSYLQGREAILNQLQKRSGEDESPLVDLYLEDIKTIINDLIERVKPYDLPDDYLYFLRTYGGLYIDHEDNYFQVFGVGPMVEDWYSSINSDQAQFANKGTDFLLIGSVSFRTGHLALHRVNFFLDLAGRLQKYSVFGIGPWTQGAITPNQVLQNLNFHTDKWKIIASSFTNWLDKAAETHGTFAVV